MKKIIYYISTALIWGSTWLAIKYQLGIVEPALSITYRFAIAGIILLVYCKLAGLNMSFNRLQHFWMALQGLFLFALNYWLVYLAEQHLPSGLVAVIFASIVFLNIFNSTLFLKTRIEMRMVIGAIIGIIGISFVFKPEISVFSLTSANFLGLVLCLIGAALASLGNIISARNQKAGLPVVQTNAWGMSYGAVFMFIITLASGKPLTFDFSSGYTISLLYLAIFGSVIAFGFYLSLIGSIGAARAGYVTLIFPLVALGLSTLVEGYRWSIWAVVGLLLVIGGNLLVLKMNKKEILVVD